MKVCDIKRFEYVEKENVEEIRKKALQENRVFLPVNETMEKRELKEPVYLVEMTASEFQLVSFYLELEKRKPIMNVKLDTKLGKENK